MKIRNYLLLLLLFCFCQKYLLAQIQIDKTLDSLQVSIDSLKDYLRKEQDDTVKVNLLNELSWHYRNLGNYDLGVKYADSALLAANRLNYKKGMALAYARLGVCSRETGNFSEALKYHLESLKISDQIEDKILIAYCYSNIGNAYADLENYPEALKNHFHSLDLKETFKLPGVSFSNKDFTNITGTFISYSSNENIANSYNNIGEVFFKQKKYTEALNYHKTALSIRVKEGSGGSESYINIGKVYHEQKKYQEALESYFMSLIYQEKYGGQRGKAICYINIGRIISEQLISKNLLTTDGGFKKAFYYLNEGLSIAQKIGDRESVILAYKGLSELYSYTRDYKKAMGYYKLYSEVKDSIFNYNTALKIEQFKIQYEVQRAVTEEKSKQEKLLAEHKAERKRRNESLIAGFIILAVVSFLIGLLIRQRNLKRRAIEKAEAAHKMAELELQSLRAQLNPHFMFNSLNAIQELILMEENDKSHTYLARFAKLLRMLLENANSPFIPLARELEFLELYLSLENLRIPDLKYRIQMDKNVNTEQTKIPNMILQPYIENAIWHGLSHKKIGERKIDIRISSQADGVRYEIEDNGVGRKKSAELKSLFRKEHRSKGMELLTKRFKLLNEEYRYLIDTQITDVMQHDLIAGTLVTIQVPWGLSREMRKAS